MINFLLDYILISLWSKLFVLFPLISTDLKVDVSSNIMHAWVLVNLSMLQIFKMLELANIYKTTLHPEMGDKQ